VGPFLRVVPIIVLAEGRLVNLDVPTVHPQLCDECKLYQPKPGTDGIGSKQYSPVVYTLPKILDEEVARLHLPRLGRVDSAFTGSSRLLGVPVEGPFKPDHYRY
jgi:adenosylhomocysteinase